MSNHKLIQNGYVIVFEGIDGVGKTTQISLVEAELSRSGYDVLSLRNLGGSPIGEMLRDVLKSDTPRPPMTDLYISLAVQEALFETIDKARKEGKIILMDRGPTSLAAYQIFGTGIDEKLGWEYVEQGMQRMKPDLIFLLKADIQTSIQRARQHSARPDYFENKPFSYFEKVSDGYDEITARYPSTIIDANQNIDEIQQAILAKIMASIPAS